MPIRPSSASRLTAVLLCAAVLVSIGCRRAGDEATPTPEAEETPSVRTAGDFQLVGRAEHAFLGEGPGIDVPARGPAASPLPGLQGGVSPPDEGVMRILLDDVSDELRNRCDADRDDRINVFWTTDTVFSPTLIQGDIEARIDGRIIGALGRIFIVPERAPDEPILGLEETATPSPAGATPGAGGEVNESCVLVADQVGTSTISAPRPRVTARPAPTPSPTPTATPTASPTASPSPTATATGSPAASP